MCGRCQAESCLFGLDSRLTPPYHAAKLKSLQTDGAMPTYEYRCDKCGEQFTLILSLREHEEVPQKCPKCQSKKVTQLLSTFTPKTTRKA